MKNYNVYDFSGIGYQKLFHYGTWRIAMLNYIDELKSDNIQYVECHHETDEAFVLLEGECRLYFYEQNEGFSYVDMIKNQTYVIPKDVYHTHVLNEKAKLLIIENEDTCDGNSTRIYFNNDLKQAFMRLGK